MLSVRMIDWTVRTECVCWFVKWMARLCDPMEHLTWMQTNKQTNNSQWTSTSCGFIDWMKEVNIIRVKWTPHRLPVTNPLSTSTHTHTHTHTHYQSQYRLTSHSFISHHIDLHGTLVTHLLLDNSSTTCNHTDTNDQRPCIGQCCTTTHPHTPAHTHTITHIANRCGWVEHSSTYNSYNVSCQYTPQSSPTLSPHTHSHTYTHLLTQTHRHTQLQSSNNTQTHTNAYIHTLTPHLLLIPETHLKCTHNWCAMHSCSHDHQ